MFACMALLFFFFLPMAAQEKVTVSGKVLDEAGVPVIGASVIEDGTQNGAITDLDGNYIGLPEGYVLISAGMGNFMNGRYCICLNPMNPSLPPAYVLDGQIYEIPVNGCLLGLGVTSTLFDDVSGQ